MKLAMNEKVGDNRYMVGSGVDVGGHGAEVAVLLLDDQIKELALSIRHLERSNIEILQEDPELEDPDFSSAIEENKGVLEHKRKRMKELTLQLLQAFPHGTALEDIQPLIDKAQGKPSQGGPSGFVL